MLFPVVTLFSIIAYTEKLFILFILFYSMFYKKFYSTHFITITLFLFEICVSYLAGLSVIRSFQAYFYTFMVISIIAGNKLFEVKERHINASMKCIGICFLIRIIDINLLQSNKTGILNENSLSLGILMLLYLKSKSMSLTITSVFLTFMVSSKIAFVSSLTWLMLNLRNNRFLVILFIVITSFVLVIFVPKMNVIGELIRDLSDGFYLSGRIPLWSFIFNSYEFPANWGIFENSIYSNPENFLITLLLTNPIFGLAYIFVFVGYCLMNYRRFILFLLPSLFYPFVLPIFLAILCIVYNEGNDA